MFSKDDRVFVTIPKHEFHGETGVVASVISSDRRTDYGKGLFDYVEVRYADETIRWFDETVLKRDRRSGEPNFEIHEKKRTPTIFNRLLGRV